MDAVCEAFLTDTLPARPSASFLALFRDTYLDEWNQGVHYIPGVPALLNALSHQYCLALVSNTHHADLVRGHLDALQVRQCFSTIVTSIEHGRRKPSSCIFDRALALTQGRPASALYIGDSYAVDYCGADAAGLRCLLIDEHGRHPIPEQARLESILDLAGVLIERA